MAMLRQTVDEKIENLKQKLNASNIIKDDVFNQSLYSQKPLLGKQSYVPMGRSNFSFKESVRIDDTKSKLEKELGHGIQLESEKKELELLVQDQVETQTKLRGEYGRQIDTIRHHIESLHQRMEDLEKQVEENSDSLLKRQDTNNAIESEINELIEENRLIETELKRLGEKTTTKLKDMQQKMQNNLNDLENLKRKNQAEHEKIKQFSMEKIKRIEDDFRNKLQSQNDKLNEMMNVKQTAELELIRLQDTKKRADIELENKLKAMKDQFYEESFNQSKGILKILNNRYKTAIDSKENLLRKQDTLMHDIGNMEGKINEDEKVIASENTHLIETINEIREEVMTAQKDLDEIRALSASLDSDQQRINAEIQKQKYNFKQINDNGKYKVREHLEKFKLNIEDARTKLGNQNQRVRALEEEYTQLKQKYSQTNNQNAKLIESMKNQLNKNIYSTLSEYKDIVNAPKDNFATKSNFNYGHY